MDDGQAVFYNWNTDNHYAIEYCKEFDAIGGLV
jgi:hypothetical protein